MSTPPPRRAYAIAVAVFAVVLTGYTVTLAPTVTFWDAGEFIATAKILGIPHPPGTPLFVLIANVWAFLVPIGEFAYRTNLMTAVFSAAAAAFFFLLVVHALGGWRPVDADAPPAEQEGRDPVFVIGGGLAGAVVGAFAFTVWQNSNETEVYMVATFSIAAICWLAWLWRSARGGGRASHLLLLIVYLAAVSLGNHLLTLLVGPALVGFLWHVQRTEPLARPEDRDVERAQLWVVAGVWALLIGLGLGKWTLLLVGGAAFAGAAMYATSHGGGVRFPLSVLAIALVGASTYLFLLVRAQAGPFINEADPSTWESLWAVISREQYPPRSPLDNPVYLSGPDNPGRSFQLIGWQLLNYLQYFDWQWSNGLAAMEPVFARVRLPFTLLFSTLAIYGASVLHRRDRSVFWLLVVLFAVTGPGLMGYMNFKPGFSVGWEVWPSFESHEVRERDYFFTVSFLVTGILAGIGLAGLYRVVRPVAGPVSVVVFGVAALPFALNFGAASRAHRPEATLARDFSYSLLQSAEPYGIIFTNGDNDTFPLWYLQEVEGVRQDVSVVNLSLGNTEWYLRQLRDNPVRPFDPDQAPWFAHLAPDRSPPPLHTWTDEEIAAVVPMLLPSRRTFRAGEIAVAFPANTPLYVKDFLILRLVQENLDVRPIYFAMTAGSGNWTGMDPYLTQEALVFRLHPGALPDSSRLAPGLFGVPIDVPRSDSLAWNVYRYGRLFDADSLALDPTNANIATNLSYVFYGLGEGHGAFGRDARALENLRRAYRLYPVPELGGLLAEDSLPALVPQDSPEVP